MAHKTTAELPLISVGSVPGLLSNPRSLPALVLFTMPGGLINIPNRSGLSGKGYL